MTAINIGTVEELQDFATRVNNGENTLDAVLTADIDMSSVSSWTPIGTSTYPYIGIFDGNGHIIKNFNYINTYKQGIFFYCGLNAIITNVSFNNILIQTTSDGWSSLIYSIDTTSISKCIFNIYNTDYSHSFVIFHGSQASSFINCIVNINLNIIGTQWYTAFLPADNNGQQVTKNIYSTGILNVSTPYSNNSGTSGLSNIFSSGGQTKYATIISSVCLMSNIDGSNSLNNMCGRICAWRSELIDKIKGSLNNCYSASTCTISNSTVTTQLGTNLPNGANCYNTDDYADTIRYDKQAFYEDTLGWDFTNTWYWDSTDNLPKLQIFKPIPSVNISNGTIWSTGTPYVYDTEWLQGEKLHVYTTSGWTEKI